MLTEVVALQPSSEAATHHEIQSFLFYLCLQNTHNRHILFYHKIPYHLLLYGVREAPYVPRGDNHKRVGGVAPLRLLLLPLGIALRVSSFISA